MLFPTITFTLFFLVFLLLWQGLGRSALSRENLLTAGGLVFYGALSPVMLAYLAGWAGLLAWAGRRPDRQGSVVMGFGLLQLLFWKSFELIPHYQLTGPLAQWAVPAGLSFFTFSGLTYLFQRQDGVLVTAWSFKRVFAFVGFFPCLLSGPIQRAATWEADLAQPQAPAPDRALALIALGLFYKLVLATVLGEYVDPVYTAPGEQPASALALAAYAYAFQLYADFCGYSMMAQGVALLLGFAVPENFKQPYLATSVQDFWRRWHCSLSSWLRDYLYIRALGGNRQGPRRKTANLMLTFLLCGAWHGLALHYLVWGAWHAISVALKEWRGLTLPKPVAWLLAFHAVVLGWIWFRASSAEDAVAVFEGLAANNWSWQPEFLPVLGWLLVAAALHRGEGGVLRLTMAIAQRLPETISGVYWGILTATILLVSPPGVPPFIYFSY